MPRNIQTGRVYSEDRQQSLTQDYINRASQFLLNRIAIKDASIIEATITTSDTVIQHGLGRNPIGYLIIDRDAAQTVYTSATTNPRPSLQIILKASGSVTAKVMVF